MDGMDIAKKILSWVLAFLPDSPFQMISNNPAVKWLPYVNWFIPVSFMISTMELWLSAIAIYYIYSMILRWVKAVS